MKKKIKVSAIEVLKKNYLKVVLFAFITVFAAGMITKSFSKGSASDSESILEITDQTFEKEISKGVVLVDFWATWCRPCRIQGNVLSEVEKEFGGDVKFGKIDIDKNSMTAERFQIVSIPTIIIFKNGNLVKTFVGLQDKETIIAALKSVAS